LVYRLVNIPLTEESYEIERQFIYDAAINNGYGLSMVNQLINRFKKQKWKRSMTTLTKSDESQKKKFIVLPYNESLKELYNTFKRMGYRVAYTNGNTIQKYMEGTKDKIPKMQQSGIYRITCPICEESYIGQTSRQFITRLKEHQSDCKKPSTVSVTSAVADHCINKNHHFDIIKNSSIVEIVQKPHTIDALESFYIQTLAPELNKDKGITPSKLYDII